MTDIDDHNNIFSPAIYHGREDEADYGQLIKDMAMPFIVQLVVDRAKADGEWCIANGRVGANNSGEPKMRRMMEFVSSEKHIQQAADHIVLEYGGQKTVDFLCRDLANASSWAVGAQDRKAGR